MILNFGKRKRLKMHLQAEAAECGLCCLVMVSGFFGYETDLVSLRRKHGISMRGATLKSVMEIAEEVKLSSRALKVELEELKNLKLPAILHWNLDHFVVLSKVSRNNVTIYDPAVGIRRYSLKEVSQKFTGIALELSPRSDFSKINEASPLTIWSFWEGANGLGASLVQILILSILIQIFSLATPFYMQIVVDDVLVKHDSDLLLLLAFGFFGVTLISVITKALRGFASLYLVNQLSYNIGNSVLHQLIRLPMSYFEKRHMGDILSRFGSTGPIQSFITGSAVAVIIDGLLAITTLILMLVYSPLLTGIVAASVAVYAVFRMLQFRPLRTANHENIAANATLDSIFIETVRALQGIKLSGKENDRQNVWRNQFSLCINSDARIGRLTISYEAINNMLTGTEHVLVIYFGAIAVLSESISIGMLYAFMAYRSNFSGAVLSIIDQLIQYWMLDLHLERLSDITQTEQEFGINSSSNLILPLTGALSTSEVSYSYSEKEPPIFKNISMQIDAGDFVAIMGPSGVGKTTFLKVLMGLLPPQEGEVLVDGMPFQSIGQKSYRHHISAVMQNDALFSGTLQDNVAFFDAVHDHGRVQKACEIARIHSEIVATPMGYNSLIGDMGSSLSVGQQQRVLIARALYREPKILFLDEGTAHVDAETELEILAGLKALGITVIFVTHNESLATLADQVIYWTESGVSISRPHH